jgi:Ca2+-binding EF-hand superfamily protein
VHPSDLQFGAPPMVAIEYGSRGHVLFGGRRWKGDLCVDFSGVRLWLKQAELEMVEPNTEPRPSTAEEERLINKQKARDRKARMKKKRQQQTKWNKNMGGSDDAGEDMAKEEIVAFFKQIDQDGSGLLDRGEFKELLIKLGRAVDDEAVDSIMHEIDADGGGEIDVEEFLLWWKRAGAANRAAITVVKDQMEMVRELFDEFDSDGSGRMGRGEIVDLVDMLGVQMNEAEVAAAMAVMDGDGSGEVDFEEFYHWWIPPVVDAGTTARLANAKARMERVRALFEELDEDMSGDLDRSEVAELATPLTGIRLEGADLDAAMRQLDADGSGSVDFAELYRWWNSKSASGVLAAAARREEEKQRWKPVAPIDAGSYRKAETEVLVRREPSRKQELTAVKGAPRLRRCTVEQVLGLRGGAGEELSLDEEVRAAFLAAAEVGDATAVQDLIDDGEAEVDGAILGVTPLMVACANGHAAVVGLLLAAGANEALADADGLTARGWVAAGQAGILALLAEERAPERLKRAKNEADEADEAREEVAAAR